MAGKICMVTGATSGIGRETALGLARQGATVVAVGRNLERSAAAVDRIERQTGNPSVEYMLADLSSQEEVRGLAAEFQRRHSRLDVLVNNAGAIMLGRRESADGIEMTWALNHLSYFLLTGLLWDVLVSSAPARIVNVSSSSHQRAGINFNDLQGQWRYRGFRAYAQSKLGNLLFTYELARRLEGSGVTANALHPGLVATNFLTNNGALGRLLCFLLGLKGISPAEGALTSLYLASSTEVEGVSGRYFVEQREVGSSPASYDRAAAGWLWQVSAELTGVERI
jgi:NAD(P)-dependent dehydrogenase (short-subunit alcohol dehydrogenase family)